MFFNTTPDADIGNTYITDPLIPKQIDPFKTGQEEVRERWFSKTKIIVLKMFYILILGAREGGKRIDKDVLASSATIYLSFIVLTSFFISLSSK